MARRIIPIKDRLRSTIQFRIIGDRRTSDVGGSGRGGVVWGSCQSQKKQGVVYSRFLELQVIGGYNLVESVEEKVSGLKKSKIVTTAKFTQPCKKGN